jgi:hypothetical protein
MILISVKSEVVDDRQQFQTDAAAMKYLLTINRLHHAHRAKIAGPKPKKIWFRTGIRAISNQRFRKAMDDYNFTMSSCINLRIEIINTKFNQLNLQLK